MEKMMITGLELVKCKMSLKFLRTFQYQKVKKSFETDRGVLKGQGTNLTELSMSKQNNLSSNVSDSIRLQPTK